MTADMIYQLFTLDRTKQERVDELRVRVGSIDKERGEKLINFLKSRYIVFVSNSARVGVYTTIIVGANSGKVEDIRTNFGKITKELGLFFTNGDSFTQIV